MPEAPYREMSRQHGILALLRADGGLMLRLCWGIFWKVTGSAAAVLFLLFVTLHNEDFRELTAQTLFGAVVVFGHCLVYAACTGIAAVVVAIAWRFWGAWIIVPILGAVLGAIGLVGLGIALLHLLDAKPAPAGVHGGGQVAALLLLAVAALFGIIGAAVGGVCGGLLAVLLGLSTRRLRRTAAQRTDSATEVKRFERPEDA